MSGASLVSPLELRTSLHSSPTKLARSQLLLAKGFSPLKLGVFRMNFRGKLCLNVVVMRCDVDGVSV